MEWYQWAFVVAVPIVVYVVIKLYSVWWNERDE